VGQIRFQTMIVDCHNLAIRGWWPNRMLSTRAGVSTGIEYGFLRLLLACIRKFQPSRTILTWDGEPVRGRSIFFGYKSNRTPSLPREAAEAEVNRMIREGAQPTDSDVQKLTFPFRIPRIRDACAASFLTLWDRGMEADEQIAGAVPKLRAAGMTPALIISGDGDLQQLVAEDVLLADKSTAVPMGPTEVEAKIKVPPSCVSIMKAIWGDASDCLPKVRGVPEGSKAAVCGSLRQWGLSEESVLKLVSEGILSQAQAERILANLGSVKDSWAVADLASCGLAPRIHGEASPGGIEALIAKLEMKSLAGAPEWAARPEPSVRGVLS
jgi:5'-3' exonuclease